MIYSLSYELRTPDKDYSPLFAHIEQMGTGAIHVMRDMWWISTDKKLDIEQECSQLQSLVGENDHFLLARISDRGTNGWLASTSWDFFKNNIHIRNIDGND